jgi:beta-lactamase regulating signal transducer with metallopeptidase domain
MSTHLTALGLTLLHVGWQALVIAAAYRLCELCLTRLSEGARYRLGLAALLAIFGLALATFLYEDIRLNLQPQTALATAAAQPQLLPLAGLSQWFPWIDAIWACGVVLLSVRLTGGLWFISRLYRASQPAPQSLTQRFDARAHELGLTGRVALRLHPGIAGPFVTGLVRSVIYLPLSSVTSLSSDQIDAVLSHELEHVLRQDYLWNLIQSAVEILFFFHPAVWWLGSRLREQRELICDDAALMACQDPLIYATALLRLEEQRQPATAPRLAMALNGHRRNLFWRIARILDEDATEKAGSSRLLRAAGAVLSLPLALVLLAAFAPPVAQSAAKAADKLLGRHQDVQTPQVPAAEDAAANDTLPSQTPHSRDFVVKADKVRIVQDNLPDPDMAAEAARQAAIQAKKGLENASRQQIDAEAIAVKVRFAAEQAKQAALRNGEDASGIDPDAIAAEARANVIKAQAEIARASLDSIDPDAIAAQVRAEVARSRAEIQRAKAEAAKAQAVRVKTYSWRIEMTPPAPPEVPAAALPAVPATPAPAALPAPAAVPAAPAIPAAPPAPKMGYVIRLTPQTPARVKARNASPTPETSTLGALPVASVQLLPAADPTDRAIYTVSTPQIVLRNAASTTSAPGS